MANNIMDMKDLKIPNNNQDPKYLMDMIMGFQKSQIIFTATKLGIFEELYHKQKALSATNLINILNLDCDATERLLNACVSLGLLESSKDDNAQNLYQCSSLTKAFLLKSSKMSFKPLVQNVGDMYHLFGKMPETIKQGQCFEMTENIFQGTNGFYCNDSRKLGFMQAMHMFCMKEAPHVVVKVDFSKYQRVCDLGGGTGALAAEIAKRHPSTEVISFDLPHVSALAQHFIDKIPQNLHFQSGDFFTEALPKADMYILSNVLHDWSESKINFILQHIYESLKTGGCLLVLEKMLNESKSGPLPCTLMDLNMLVGSEGKERSALEYQQLLNKQCFTRVTTVPLQFTMNRDIILAYKA